MMNDKQMPPQPPSYGFTSAPAPPQPMGYPPPQHTFGSFAPPPPQYGYPPQPPPGQGYPPAAGYPPQAYAPPQPPPNFQQPEPVVVVPAGGWYSRNQKNKPQSNSASVAALIFISGGMNIAWSGGFRVGVKYSNLTHIQIAWFIGAIIGAIISAFLANKVPKKIVGLFSAVLVTIAGIVVASTTYNEEAITAGLYLDGIANGLVFPPFIALVGEVSVFYMRGLNAATIDQLCFITGYMVQVIYTSSWTSNSYYTNFTSDNMKGVLSAVYGILGIIFGALLCIESPVIELANGEEQKAIDILRRLQRPYTVTNETYEQLAEHKRYLAQNKDLTVGQSIVRAIPAFLRLCFLRALNAMSLASYITYTIIIASTLTGYSSLGWYVGFGLCRWFGNFITTFCMESVGRKKPILIGLLVCGGMSFGIASQHELSKFLSGIPTMMLVFQFFAGVAFTATTPYLTEAYPLGVKQHFIAFTFIVEMLVFLIIGACTWSFTGGANYFYIIGVLYVIGFIAGIFCLPETKRTTLRQAQDKFKGISSRGF